MQTIPVIDIAPLINGEDPRGVAEAVAAACSDHGFFYIIGHDVDQALQHRLDAFSREFFELPEAQKMKIAMKFGGKAWRGFFPVGGELTSGKPDLKEGLYFGEELESKHPRVKVATPLHGRNLFPQVPVGFDGVVLDYMKAMTGLGHRLMEAFSLALGLEAGYFRANFTADPLTLFRIFHYPPQRASSTEEWGVGEHTDYGLLTILKQDDAGGLQVWSKGGWIDAPPVEGAFVCNIGDMLEKMTGGLFRSTPHRVRNTSGRERYSYPFFFDPGWDVEIKPVVQPAEGGDSARKRWDGADIHAYRGTYGDYILSKVSKVFPDLAGGQ